MIFPIEEGIYQLKSCLKIEEYIILKISNAISHCNVGIIITIETIIRIIRDSVKISGFVIAFRIYSNKS